MDKITRTGIDWGKRAFHVTAVDASDRVWSATVSAGRDGNPAWQSFRFPLRWRWRPAAAPITGAVWHKDSVIRFS